MKVATIIMFLLAKAAANSADPCSAHKMKACLDATICSWVQEDGGHASSNHQEGRKTHRGCHMIGVTDRDSIKGHSSNGAANDAEVAALTEMGFHTKIEEMACEEAFNRKDCKTLAKRGVDCEYACGADDESSDDDHCVVATDETGNLFPSCEPPPPAVVGPLDCSDCTMLSDDASGKMMKSYQAGTSVTMSAIDPAKHTCEYFAPGEEFGAQGGPFPDTGRTHFDYNDYNKDMEGYRSSNGQTTSEKSFGGCYSVTKDGQGSKRTKFCFKDDSDAHQYCGTGKETNAELTSEILAHYGFN